MGTRLNPGRFDCYSAALADEEQFVLNARDPAFSPTIRFWITQREAMIGRGEKPVSDNEMLTEAGLCATRGVAWRSDNAMVSIFDKFASEGDQPVFVGPRWQYEQPPETREEWENAFRTHITGQDCTINRLNCENVSLRVEVATQDQAIDTLRSQDVVSQQTISRLTEQLVDLRGVLADKNGRMAEDQDTIIQLRAQLASANMERDRLEGRLEAAPRPEIVSEDLAEPPEINDHRFGHLEKHGDYAYARGLTVSPTHLPKALHQMQHDFGWRLVAIFGETTAEKIGFIFKRVEPDIDQLIAAKTEMMTKLFKSIGFADGGTFGSKSEGPIDIISSTGGEFIVPLKVSLEDADTIRSLRSIAGREAAKAIDETTGETERLALYTHRCGINPEGLYPETAELVRGFASALAHRLLEAQADLKRPLGWLHDDWEENCRTRLYKNLAANSKIDAAAFLAFMWYRQWTSDYGIVLGIADMQESEEAFNEVLRVRMLEVARHTRIAAIAIITESGAADLNDLMTKPLEVRTAALEKALSFLVSTTKK